MTDHKSRAWAWIDWVVPFLAVCGLACSLIPDFMKLAVWDVPASDFKTLFASAKLYAAGLDPYNPALIQHVFEADAVARPPHWYGHMPVYPPFTLAVLSIFHVMDIVAASLFWLSISVVSMAVALALLSRWAREELGLPVLGRVFAICLCTICPFLGFALDMVNINIVTCGLCLIAFALRGRPWSRGSALALALILKPHVALWMVIALFFDPHKGSRMAAKVSVALAAAFVAVSSALLALGGHLVPFWQPYASMLKAESSGVSSMSPASHEALPMVSQIFSAWSLGGYFSTSIAVKAVTGLFLLACALVIVRGLIRADVQHEEQRTLAASACVSFGMIATYHRAHDATLLFLLIPLIACWIWKRSRRIAGIALLILLLGTWYPLPGAGGFLELRQGALFAWALTVALAGLLIAEGKKKPVQTV